MNLATDKGDCDVLYAGTMAEGGELVACESNGTVDRTLLYRTIRTINSE